MQVQVQVQVYSAVYSLLCTISYSAVYCLLCTILYSAVYCLLCTISYSAVYCLLCTLSYSAVYSKYVWYITGQSIYLGGQLLNLPLDPETNVSLWSHQQDCGRQLWIQDLLGEAWCSAVNSVDHCVQFTLVYCSAVYNEDFIPPVYISVLQSITLC